MNFNPIPHIPFASRSALDAAPKDQDPL